ncbi:MAG TPA: hypothetical protein VF102_04430 [Gemmatimonadaceae bacterium]
MTQPNTFTESKGGHRVIWMPYTAEDGRTFHLRHEDNGGIPGTYVGFSPDGGLTWTCVRIGTREDMDAPLRAGKDICREWPISRLGAGGSAAILPVAWAWDEAEARALNLRHIGAVCARCGSVIEPGRATIDARTVEERAYCARCAFRLWDTIFAARVHYRQFACACGVMCYVQLKPVARERGDYNDVLPCPKCARLACAECLPAGATHCRGCVKTRRRRAA